MHLSGIAPRRRRLRIHQQSGLPRKHGLAVAGFLDRHHGSGAGHRLQRGQTEGLQPGGADGGKSPLVTLGHLGFVETLLEAEGDPAFRCQPRQSGGLGAGGHHHPQRRAPILGQAGERLDHEVVPLDRRGPAD